MSRQQQGSTGYHAGLQAERSVARHYLRRGYTFAAHRFRAGRGEIDLVLRHNGDVVFVEVKHSRTIDRAAARVSAAQMQRIFDTASQFIAGEPGGQDTAMRFDVALVDGTGQIEILENALFA